MILVLHASRGRSLLGVTLLFVSFVGNKSCATKLPEEDTYLAGKAQYEGIVSKSEMPQFGACWKSALHRTTNGCKHLTNTITHQLAYDFTRCFYIELGEDIPECTVLPEVCKDNLGQSIVHGTYAMFFMHTRNMCYFLENQAWQERTDETVVELSRASQQVVERLESAQRLQEKIATGQEETLTQQQSILDNSASLAAKIVSMQNGVIGLLTEFQQTYNEQMMAVGQVFDKITSLEKLFLAEYTGTQAFLLWLGAVIISYLVTSTPRTYGARFPLFLLTLMFAVLELTIINHSVSQLLCEMFQSKSTSLFTDTTVCVYLCIKSWRWFYGVCNLLILFYCAATYEDYDSKIYRAVVELQSDIKLLKNVYQQPALLGKGLSSNEVVQGSLESALAPTIIKVNAAGRNTFNACNVGDSSDCDSQGSTSGSDCDSDSTYQATTSSNGSVSSDTIGTEMSVTDSELDSIACSNKGKSLLKQTLLERAAELYTSPGGTRYNLRPRSAMSPAHKAMIGETERQFVRTVKQLTKNRSRFPNSSYAL